MEITPNEIAGKEFSRVMRGLDPVEVREFLEQVSADFAAEINRRRELEKHLEELERELKDYRRLDRKIRDSLVNAQDSAGALKEEARREADLIIKEARIKAEELLSEARGALSELKREQQSLQQEMQTYVSRYRGMVRSQLELLDLFAREEGKDV